jgi:hypothetical protein
MFDKSMTLTSTDSSVSLTVVAGTEGLKSITVHVGTMNQLITAQKLIDLAAPALKEWAAQNAI